MEKLRLNRFLKTRAEVNEATNFIKANGLAEHALSCKNFDISLICSNLGDGNLLDMGFIGSHVLDNAVKLGLTGRKVGIDLLYKEEFANDWPNLTGHCEFYSSDLMNTPFEDGSFQNITCLSVIEHSVDFNLLAKECARLLTSDGQLFLTFDYFDPKPDTSKTKLYDLAWNILDRNDVLTLIEACKNNGLVLLSDIDWTLGDAVINPTFCSPTDVSYTFGCLMFKKVS